MTDRIELGIAVRRYGWWRGRRSLFIHVLAAIGALLCVAMLLHHHLTDESVELCAASGSTAAIAALGSAIQEWRWRRNLMREWARAHGKRPSVFDRSRWFGG